MFLHQLSLSFVDAYWPKHADKALNSQLNDVLIKYGKVCGETFATDVADVVVYGSIGRSNEREGVDVFSQLGKYGLCDNLGTNK